MAATTAHKIAIADGVTALGNTISIHSTDPGTTGAGEVTDPDYARQDTVWAGAVIGTGADAGKAVAVGSVAEFELKSGTVAAYFGVWNGTTFLRGEALTPSVTMGADGKVDVTPYYKYTHTA